MGFIRCSQCTYTHTQLHLIYIHTHICVFVYITHMYLSVYVFVYIYSICVCICMHVRVCAFVNICHCVFSGANKNSHKPKLLGLYLVLLSLDWETYRGRNYITKKKKYIFSYF